MIKLFCVRNYLRNLQISNVIYNCCYREETLMSVGDELI